MFERAPRPATEPYKIHPYEPIEALLPGLWRVVGTSTPMKRVMYVYRLPDGGLLLDSVVAMHEADMAALERLGTPKVMVLPHPKHWLDAQFYKARFPQLEVLGELDVRSKVPTLRFDGTLVERLPAYGVTAHPVPGMKLHEVVLDLPIHDESGTRRALLFSDLVNKSDPDRGVLGTLFGGVAWVLKLTQIADEYQVRAFLRRLAALPSIALVAGCHGGVVSSHCSEFLIAAADEL